MSAIDRKAAIGTETAEAASEAGWATVGAICHVEFRTPDLEEASKFYAEIFGWEFQPKGADEWMFATPARGAGVCGCMIRGAPAASGTTVLYVNVAEIEATLGRAARRGATTVRPKTAIGEGHGFCAELRAPDGNIFGVWSMR
jgi:predicted enzyme related to lactoylglutathione lyase